MNTTTPTTIDQLSAQITTILAFAGAPLPTPMAGAQLDDDAVLDSWLADLDISEFELILNRLADVQAPGRFRLEPSA